MSDHPRDPARLISAEVLLKGKSELYITHGGETYKLEITDSGELMLTPCGFPSRRKEEFGEGAAPTDNG